MAGASNIIEAFRDSAGCLTRAQRAVQNSLSVGDNERADNALTLQKLIEDEIGRCFIMVRKPDWTAVADAAGLDIRQVNRRAVA